MSKELKPTVEDKVIDYRDETEQLRVQLAGCGVAALGGIQGDMLIRQGDYGWSASYQDVVNLRLKYDALHKQLEDTNTELRETMHGFVLQREAFIESHRECDALRKQLETSYKTLKEARAESENLYKQLEIAVEWIESMVINDGTHADVSISAERKLAEIKKVGKDE